MPIKKKTQQKMATVPASQTVSERARLAETRRTTTITAESRNIHQLFGVLNEAFDGKSLRLRDFALDSEIVDNGDDLKATRKLARLLRRFEETLEHLDIGIMMVDQKDRLQLCNHRIAELLGIPAEFLNSRPLYSELVKLQFDMGEFIGLDEVLGRSILALELQETPKIYRRMRPNGTLLEVKTIPLALGGFIRTFTDVTESAAHEKALLAAKTEYQGLFENSLAGIFRSSPDGKQIKANPALVRLNRYNSEAEMLAGVGDIAKEWYVDPGRRDEFKRQMAENGRVTDFVSQIYRHATREPIWISETAWQVTDTDGQIYYEGTITETTERKEAEDRIAHMAMHDQLTGLGNRAAFVQKLQQAIISRGDQRVSVFSIDLDSFKDINDSFGHTAGDSLLVKVALAIRQCAAKGDFIARLGGDEFAIIRVGNSDTIAELGVVAASLVQQLSQTFFVDNKRMRIGACVGFAALEPNEPATDFLLQNADTALYAAKKMGARSFRFFDETIQREQAQTRDLEADLREALEKNGFQLYYQPICDLGTGCVVSYETLLRWPHPFHGMIPPTEFIPLAEKSGMMVPLGDWIIETACSEARNIPGALPVAVNISYTQLCDPRFLSTIRGALKRNNIAASQLQIEITESVFMVDNDTTVGILNELREMGIKIALDDFGTGYSSLSYLQKFSFDKIKIDRSFINDTRRKSVSGAIIRAVIQLGKDLDIPIIAEGIETDLQLRALQDAECSFGQGYFFGRPAPVEKLG
ncbi:MAG: putative bifunctional diguanylate cyclase/phosphodiesterase [Beijerinckiaceae bacterium]